MKSTTMPSESSSDLSHRSTLKKVGTLGIRRLGGPSNVKPNRSPLLVLALKNHDIVTRFVDV